MVVLFLLLLAALIYQLTVHGTGGTPACGPTSPNALPTRGACSTPTATPS